MKNLSWKRASAGVAAFAAAGSGLFALGVGATPASAATQLSYGFDGNAHLIVGGGSDTTYTTMLALGDIWNEDNTAFNNGTASSGTTCSVVTSATAGSGSYPSSTPVGNQRSSAQQANAPTPQSPGATNCNHDTVAEAYPSGSSTGIASMNGNNKGTAGVFPYEGTNPITNSTNNVMTETPAPVVVTAINGSTAAVSAGTAITSVTLTSVPENIAATNSLTLTNGTTPLSLTVSAAVTSTAGGAATVTVNSATAGDTYTPGAATVTDTAWVATAFNGYGTPDFARSSRQPNLSGGNCAGGNELTCDTFFGFATDGVQIFSWNFGSVNRATEVAANMPGGLTADDLCMIWTGQWTQWSQLPGMGAIPDNGPIVPWRMNSASGTEATFNNFIKNNTQDTNHCTGVSTLDVSAVTTARPLHDGTSPFENDTKPILNDAINNIFNPVGGSPAGVSMPQCPTANDAAGIVNNVASCQDPSNWIWWGSFGLMSSHVFLASPTLSGTTYNSASLPLADQGTTAGQENPVTCGQNGTQAEPGCLPNPGLLPGSSDISSAQYPLTRDLYIAAPKASADCPLNAASLTEGGNTYAPGTVCDLTGTAAVGQQADIQVNGASGGSAGATREFVRFVCRNLATQQTLDSFSKTPTGTNVLTEITTALSNNGFVLPPTQSATHGLTTGFQTAFKQAGLGRSNGSRCSVLSIPNTTPAP